MGYGLGDLPSAQELNCFNRSSVSPGERSGSGGYEPDGAGGFSSGSNTRGGGPRNVGYGNPFPSDFSLPSEFPSSEPLSDSSCVDDNNLDLESIWNSIKQTGKDVFEKGKEWLAPDKSEPKSADKPIITEKTPEIKKPEKYIPKDKSSLILAYQQYFKSRGYSGPVDGIMNPELIQIAQKIEPELIEKLKNAGDPDKGMKIAGKFWNLTTKMFLTPPDDLIEAFDLLEKHRQNTKVASIKTIFDLVHKP